MVFGKFPAILVVKVVNHPSATKSGSILNGFRKIPCHFGCEGGQLPIWQPNKEASNASTIYLCMLQWLRT